MKIATLAKYVDQPVVLNKLQEKMPAILIAGGAAFGVHDMVFHSSGKKGDKGKQAVKNVIILSTTIAASLIGARGLKIGGQKIIKGLMENKPLQEVIDKQKTAVQKFIDSTKPSDKKIIGILEKSKENHLSLKEIETLTEKLPESSHKKELFDVIFPKPKNTNSKKVFSEIGRLSLLGLIPVVGGIVGGLAADEATNTSSRKSVANKIKEGFYQYFANIFLCNVGAGAALYGAEKLQEAKVIKPLTPTKKLGVIMGGIVAMGIVGGSAIANYMSKKIIDPMFKQKEKKNLYSERKPELLDVALHVDDIATAGVLSGFKWIEPALPFMYFISGYRAGIGYRNGEGHHVHNSNKANKPHKHHQHPRRELKNN